MTPTAGGRHCTACAKTVTDFTHMTDAQILEVLRRSAGGCGQFRNDQLNRNLVFPPAKHRFSLLGFYKVAASFLLVFSAGKTTAQEKTATHFQEKIEEIESDTIAVFGIVRDKKGELLVGAILKIDDTHIEALSGVDGNFRLQIPYSLFKSGAVKCSVYFSGFEAYHLTIRQSETRNYLQIALSPINHRPHLTKGRIAELPMGKIRIEQPKKWWQFWKRSKK